MEDCIINGVFFNSREELLFMGKVFIPDISILTKEEWRERRKAGIGGSDVGIILGLSKYMSAFDLFYNKIGAKIEKKETEASEITKEIGSRLEDLVADIFQRKYQSIQVLEDNTMYQHEEYPFMLANFDRRLVLPDGRFAILECKTVTNSSEWESTDFCQGIEGKCPLSYEYQYSTYKYCGCRFSDCDRIGFADQKMLYRLHLPRFGSRAHDDCSRGKILEFG